MEVDFIVTVAALCLIQVLLSVLCFRLWKQKEYWQKLYYTKQEKNEELMEALDRATDYAIELESKNDQLFEGMPRYKPYSKDEDAVW